jgi:hypothetical protein
MYLLEAKGEDMSTSVKQAETRRLAYVAVFEVFRSRTARFSGSCDRQPV